MRKNAKKSKKIKKKFANTKIVCIFATETKTNNDMKNGLTFEELSKVFANIAKLEKAYEEYERKYEVYRMADRVYMESGCNINYSGAMIDAYAERNKAEKKYEKLSKEIIKDWALNENSYTEDRIQKFAGNIYRAGEFINYVKNYAKELVKYMD